MTIYYLYVKTHNKTGFKYLGQTRQDPYSYLGSGADWLEHLKEYGNDISTEIILSTTDKSERNAVGRRYSNLWRILTAVDNYGNKIWANRIIESGGGAGGKFGVKRKESTKEKLIIANTGPSNPAYGTKWITDGVVNKKIDGTDSVPSGWWYGRTFCEKLQETFVHRSKVGRNNPGYDPTPYQFVNEKESIVVVMSKYDFSKTYNVRGRVVRELVRGRISSYKGWTANIC